MGRYNKAWVSLLTGAAGVAAMHWPELREHVGPEQIQAVAVLLTTLGVYQVANK